MQAQNTVNPAGQIGGEPGAARAAVHLHGARARAASTRAEEFGNIVVRANPDGSIVRVKDVARVELGAQTYNSMGRLNGQARRHHRRLPAARLNAIDTVDARARR